MADIQSYERVLKKKQTGLKVALIALYAVVAGVWLVLAVRVGLHPAMILLAPLSVVIAVLLTWRYTNVEYEYSFMAGTLTFSKIYGKSRRKTLLEVDIKSLSSVFPYNERTASKISDGKRVNGIPSSTSENPCVCAFEDENENKVYFVLDCDEQSAKIFKFFNPSATDRAIFDALKRIESEDKNA